MIVISNSLVFGEAPLALPNNPLIGWHNIVTPAGLTADTAAANFPIVNVANPITARGVRWQAADATAQAILIEISDNIEIDYLAIARHNLASAGIAVSIDGRTTEIPGEGEGEGEDDGWFELVQGAVLPNDGPALFRFEKQSLAYIRINLAAGSAAAEIAVIYAGALLVLQRRIYVGHVPLPYGRSARIVNGKSEGGDFLGRILLSEQTATAVDLQNIEPDWYRANMDAFVLASKTIPFFFAWRPQEYPNEVGFAWMTNDPKPANQRSNGMMQIQLQMTGISL